jgi:folate-binding protein YgfZ
MLESVTAVSSFEREYLAATEGCALFDRSDRGKLALTGAGAKEFLNGQVSNDTVSLQPGHGLYAALLTPKGKMLADLRILDAGEELLLDTERVALQTVFNTIRRFSIGYELELHKRTLQRSLLSLIGPSADAVARAAGLAELPAETEHDHRSGQLAGTDVRVIRTDLGLDVLLDAEALAEVRSALLAAGAAEIGLETAECVRIESGRPRYGVELDDSVIPQEAGLNDRAVSFTKGCYVGQETVARLFYRGKPNRELRGLRSAEPLPVGTELTYEARTVGRVRSAAVSPRLGPVALAFIRREAPLGAVLAAGETGSAEVVELPFS